MTTYLLEGRTLFIDGKPHQISDQDTVYCPECHQESFYWQVPWSSCYAGETIEIVDNLSREQLAEITHTENCVVCLTGYDCPELEALEAVTK